MLLHLAVERRPVEAELLSGVLLVPVGPLQGLKDGHPLDLGQGRRHILAAADFQFSHIFRCVDMTNESGDGYNQISIRPLHGDNLLERLRMAELEVSIES